MKTIFVIFLFFVLTSAFTDVEIFGPSRVHRRGRSKPDYTKYDTSLHLSNILDGTTYIHSAPFKKTWHKAFQYCRQRNMELVDIPSYEENARVLLFIRDSGFADEAHWTSGTDIDSEGKFYWMNTGQYVEWESYYGQPPDNSKLENGNTENCLEIKINVPQNQWNDNDCSKEYYFICKSNNDITGSDVLKKISL